MLESIPTRDFNRSTDVTLQLNVQSSLLILLFAGLLGIASCATTYTYSQKDHYFYGTGRAGRSSTPLVHAAASQDAVAIIQTAR